MSETALHQPLLDHDDSRCRSSRGEPAAAAQQHQQQQQQQQQQHEQQHVCVPLPLPAVHPHASSKKRTFWPGVMYMTKAITGAGMLAIPRAYVQVGWLAGSVMLLLVGLLSWLTMVVLVRGAQQHGCVTYAGLVEAVFGSRRPACRLPLQLSILGFCLGFSVAYLVTVRDVLVDLLADWSPHEQQAVSIDPRLLIIAVASCMCAPALLSIRSLERLRITNSLGVAASALLAAAAGGLGLAAAARGSVHAIPMLPAWSALGPTRGAQLEALTDVLPVLLACFVAHQSVFPLLPLLQPCTCAAASRVIAAALAISGCLFLVLSVGAAAAFGPDALAVNCLDNMSVEQLAPLLGSRAAAVALSWALRLGVAVSVLATLLLFMWPLRAGLAEMLWPDPDGGAGAGTAADAGAAACLASASSAAAAADRPALEQPPPDQAQPLQQQPGMQGQMGLWPALEAANYVPLTFALLAVMTLLAAATPNIFAAVSVVGDLAGTTQAFIYPGLLALLMQRRRCWRAAAGGRAAGASRRSAAEAAAAVCIVALGVALFCNGIISRLEDLVGREA